MDLLKRKVSSNGEGPDNKKPRQGRPGKQKFSRSGSSVIEPGDAGIWATCDRNREGRAAADLQDLFERYAVKLYGEACLDASSTRSIEKASSGSLEDAGAGVDDIESEIARELHSLKSKPRHSAQGTSGQVPGSQILSPIFQPVRIEAPCLLFFKTQPPIQPDSFVHSICRDAADGTSERMSRYVKRLTPVTRIGKATEAGLEEVAKEVLGPVFGVQKGIKPLDPGERKEQGWLACRLGDYATKLVVRAQFAIRPTIRNHSTMRREQVIQTVATLVGPGHEVDLKEYDALILVEIYQSILGMSIVGSDHEELRRYNLAEISDSKSRLDETRTKASTE